MAGQAPASLPHLGLVLAPKELVAESGSYTVSGQAAALSGNGSPAPLPHLALLGGLGGRIVLVAESGTYGISGQAAGLPRAYRVAANVGFYTLAGKAGILQASGARAGDPAPLPHLGLLLAPSTASYTLTANTGIYTVAGSDALADHEVTAESGTYTIAGQDAGLLKTTIMVAESGTYSIAGQEATFSITGTDRVMPADTSTYAIAGQDAALTVGRVLAAEHGFYALLGQAAELVYAPPNEYTLTAEGGTYAFTGQTAELDARRLYAEYGTYRITGVDIVSPAIDVGAGRSRRRSRRYIARYRGQDYEFADEDAMEEFIAEKTALEREKPKRERHKVRVIETPEEEEDDALLWLI